MVQSERGATTEEMRKRRREEAWCAWCDDGRDEEETKKGAWWAWCARGLVRKKSVVQSERGARRAWCADEVETKKRRGGRCYSIEDRESI